LHAIEIAGNERRKPVKFVRTTKSLAENTNGMYRCAGRPDIIRSAGSFASLARFLLIPATTTGVMMRKFPKQPSDRLEPLTRLSGTSIRDSQGELVGRVTDFIIDVSDARLAYLSIALHPVNGGDDSSRVIVPWSIVTLERGPNGGLRVAVRRKTLIRIANSGSDR
jgi:sporulation protein YlmC with PRC-barrel domain